MDRLPRAVASPDPVIARHRAPRRDISAPLVLGASLDAGADVALVQRILGTVTLPRIALMRGKERARSIAGTVASVAIGPVRRDTLFIDAIRALESGQSPLAIRTWGG